MTLAPNALGCPHCGAANEAGAFCAACGKALPTGSVPRIVTAKSMATTLAGQQVQSEELQKCVKKAANALLIVAIIQAIFGTVLFLIARNSTGTQSNPIVYYIVYGIGFIFLGLFLWARSSPLPATIIGLTMYLTLLVMDAVADPRTLLQGFILKIFIIAVLGKGIQAALQHKRMLEELRRR